LIYLISISFLASALIIGNAAFSVCLGVAFSFFYKPEIDFITRRVSTIPLQIGIVILGLTIGLGSVYETGENYLSWITLFVFLSFFGGLLISRIFSLDKTLSILISSGAAICGATAIAAVAPIIKAKPHELVIALTTIFIFNIIALISFPYIGSALSLTEVQFGSFVALAVHDTSSVIGTALGYSPESVEVAATLKMARTLWLIPLIILLNFIYKNDESKSKYPKFVFFFIVAVLINSYSHMSIQIELLLRDISKIFLITGLFCIGTQTSSIDFKSLSIKPFVFGLALWLIALPTAYLIVIHS
jgi:uncharacterized integral membrane protein (TIGR00698 family)